MPNDLYSLVPLADFKALLGIDDREDCLNFASVRNSSYEFLHSKNSANLFQPPSLAAFCLLTATYTIEQYCKRRFVRRKNTDCLTFAGEYIFTLREYPVWKVLTVHAVTAGAVQRGEALFSPENLVDPKHYYCLPEPSTDIEGEGSPLDEGIHEDIPFSLVLRPPYRLAREEMGIKVRYLAGYSTGKAPADLASACLELAAWNMSRYRGRCVGMTGNVRGNGKDGERLETSMPENVRLLLEPYKRRVI
jgi:hypothetical protein